MDYLLYCSVPADPDYDEPYSYDHFHPDCHSRMQIHGSKSDRNHDPGSVRMLKLLYDTNGNPSGSNVYGSGRLQPWIFDEAVNSSGKPVMYCFCCMDYDGISDVLKKKKREEVFHDDGKEISRRYGTICYRSL